MEQIIAVHWERKAMLEKILDRLEACPAVAGHGPKCNRRFLDSCECNCLVDEAQSILTDAGRTVG